MRRTTRLRARARRVRGAGRAAGDAPQLGRLRPRVAEALGGHCVSLRRTHVGPFDVADADPDRIIPADEALAALGTMKVARHTPGARRRPASRRARHLRRRAPRPPAGDRGRARAGPEPTVVTFDPHPGRRSATGSSSSPRSSGASSSWRSSASKRRSSSSSRSSSRGSSRRSSPRRCSGRSAREVVVPGRTSGSAAAARGPRRSWRGSASRRAGADSRGVSSTGSASSSARGRRGAARLLGQAGRGRGDRRHGRRTGRHARFPDREPRRPPGAARAGERDLRGAAGEHRAAVSIGTNPHYGGRERRVEAHLLDFRRPLRAAARRQLWERLRDEAAFDSEDDLIAQIAEDVEAARRAKPPA